MAESGGTGGQRNGMPAGGGQQPGSNLSAQPPSLIYPYNAATLQAQQYQQGPSNYSSHRHAAPICKNNFATANTTATVMGASVRIQYHYPNHYYPQGQHPAPPTRATRPPPPPSTSTAATGPNPRSTARVCGQSQPQPQGCWYNTPPMPMQGPGPFVLARGQQLVPIPNPPMDLTHKAYQQAQKSQQFQQAAAEVLDVKAFCQKYGLSQKPEAQRRSSGSSLNGNQNEKRQNTNTSASTAAGGDVSMRIGAEPLERRGSAPAVPDSNPSVNAQNSETINDAGAVAPAQAPSTQIQNWYHASLRTAHSFGAKNFLINVPTQHCEGQVRSAFDVFAIKSALEQKQQQQPPHTQAVKTGFDLLAKQAAQLNTTKNTTANADLTAVVAGETPKVGGTAPKAVKQKVQPHFQAPVTSVDAATATGARLEAGERARAVLTKEEAVRKVGLLVKAAAAVEGLCAKESKSMLMSSPSPSKPTPVEAEAAASPIEGSSEEQQEQDQHDADGEKDNEAEAIPPDAADETERRARPRSRRKRKWLDSSDVEDGNGHKTEDEDAPPSAKAKARARENEMTKKKKAVTPAPANAKKTTTPNSTASGKEPPRCVKCGRKQRNLLKFRNCSSCNAFYDVDCVHEAKGMPKTVGKFHWRCIAKGCRMLNEDFESSDELMKHREKHGKVNTYVRERTNSVTGFGRRSSGAGSGIASGTRSRSTSIGPASASTPKSRREVAKSLKETRAAASARTRKSAAPTRPQRKAGRPPKEKKGKAKRGRWEPYWQEGESDDEAELNIEPKPRRARQVRVRYTELESEESGPEDYCGGEYKDAEEEEEDEKDGTGASDEEGQEGDGEQVQEEDGTAGGGGDGINPDSAPGTVSEASVSGSGAPETMDKPGHTGNERAEAENSANASPANQNDNEGVGAGSPSVAEAGPSARPPTDPATRIGAWSTEDVRAHFISKGMEKEAEVLYTQEIDGLALEIIRRNDLEKMNLKMGPVLRIERVLRELKLLPPLSPGGAGTKRTGVVGRGGGYRLACGCELRCCDGHRACHATTMDNDTNGSG